MRKMIPRRKPPLLQHDRVAVHHGDCLEVMAAMPEASVDTVVTDPPYHLTQASRGGSPRKNDGRKNTPYKRHRVGDERGFMGKTWDGGGITFDPDTWRAVLRVAKPGATLLAFGGTRTFHRLACAVEDAGWELRDCVMWVYGSGFPKSTNISKKIDKEAGVERKVLQTYKGTTNIGKKSDGKIGYAPGTEYPNVDTTVEVTAPVTPAAKLWDGWGTALKPSWEPIIVAQKPLDGTYAANAQRHGVAGLWIDGGKIGTEQIETRGMSKKKPQGAGVFRDDNWVPKDVKGTHIGRWPANLILQHSPDCVRVGTAPDPGYVINRFKDGAKPFGDGAGHEYESETVPAGEREVYACVPGCPVRMLDVQSGIGQNPKSRPRAPDGPAKATFSLGRTGGVQAGHGDSGGASRFFYTAKASSSERVLGCPPGFRNNHPTVKPLDLCRYLCRLTRTPTGGVVLDPFSGSGSIAVAALLEGRTAIAIELEEESARCTVGRVEAALKYGDKLQGLKRYRLKGRKRLKRER